jgi:hypothetical protein
MCSFCLLWDNFDTCQCPGHPSYSPSCLRQDFICKILPMNGKLTTEICKPSYIHRHVYRDSNEDTRAGDTAMASLALCSHTQILTPLTLLTFISNHLHLYPLYWLCRYFSSQCLNITHRFPLCKQKFCWYFTFPKQITR